LKNHNSRTKKIVKKLAKNKISYKDVIKIDDSPLAYFFFARMANIFLPGAINRGCSANQITFFSLILSGFAALSFIPGSRWLVLIGSLLIMVSFILDCLDGQLARYTGQSTSFGYWLDLFGDRVRELGLWVCLCVGYARLTGNLIVWQWGMIAAVALSLRIAEDLYRHKALLSQNENFGESMTSRKSVKVSIRIWIQRFFYFSIAERTLFLALAAPLGLAIIFFKVVTVFCITMTIIFSIRGWHQNREKAF
jgi:phosphatidylglycerophosphate synthase